MSDEREMHKPTDPDFQLHLHKTGETVEPEPDAEVGDADGADDFELHMHKPGGGIADQLKGQLKD